MFNFYTYTYSRPEMEILVKLIHEQMKSFLIKPIFIMFELLLT